MSTMKIEPGQLWKFGNNYYLIIKPHSKYKDGWRLMNLSNPYDTEAWDYGAEIIRNFTFIG